MPSEFKPDPNGPEFVDNVSRSYYQDKVIAETSATDEQFQFKLAAARAKDRARHKLIRAMAETAQWHRTNQGRLTELGSFLSGDRTAENEKRSIDGVPDAPDEAIKL